LPADAAREERALRSVAEVVAWVASGAEVESPRASVGTVRTLDMSQQDDEQRAATAGLSIESPREGRDAPRRDRSSVTVSVGTIELTVEDPAGVAAPALPMPPPAAQPGVTGASASRLSRYYLRP
jgi:hypothetical protein